MYAIEVRGTFSAAHALRLAEGVTEPLHGHDFTVTARITAGALDALGTVLDFHEVASALERILRPLQNANLNAIEPFRSTVNPSAECLAEHIGRQLEAVVGRIAGGGTRQVRVGEVRITEAVNCVAVWIAGA